MVRNQESPLTGGRSTPGVVRVADTVRRPLQKNSPFVHALLKHLETSGFQHAPRLLGVDEGGREILTFIEGWVPSDLGYFSTFQIKRAARILALFHQVTSGSELAGSQEVVCHGDASPCNFVFQNRAPVALIDFDTAFPGPRSLDVGYAVWLWLDIGEGQQRANEVGLRMRAFLDAYEAFDKAGLVEAVLAAQKWLMARCHTEIPSRARSQATFQWAKHCLLWTEQHRERIESLL